METIFLKKAYKNDVHISELQSWMQNNLTNTIQKHGKLISSQLVVDDDMYLHIITIEFYV